jgi:hypothetical protein
MKYGGLGSKHQSHDKLKEMIRGMKGLEVNKLIELFE